MIKELFILLPILALADEQIIVDYSKHCDCSELSNFECNYHTGYWCQWQNDKCVSHNQDCENLKVEEDCGWQNFQKKCQWSNSSCQAVIFSQLTTQSDCVQSGGFWKNSTCSETFTKCEDYTEDDCPKGYYFQEANCYTSDNLCLPRVYPDCSDLNHCSGGYNDYTSKERRYFCRRVNDTCLKVDSYDPCPSLNGLKETCEDKIDGYDCTYEEPNCRPKKCSEVTSEEQCSSLKASKIKVLYCEWKDEKCYDRTDYPKLGLLCYGLTAKNYIWDWKESKCRRCKKLVDSIIVNSNQTNSNINTGTNSSTNSGTNSTNNSGSNSTSSFETNSTSSSGTNSTNSSGSNSTSSSGTNSTSSSGTNSDSNPTNNSTTNSTTSQTQTSSFGNTICRITFQIVVIVFLFN